MKAILRATLATLVLTILTSPTSTQVNPILADGAGPIPTSPGANVTRTA